MRLRPRGGGVNYCYNGVSATLSQNKILSEVASHRETHPKGFNTVMLNLFQHLIDMELPLQAGKILKQVQDDTVIGGVPC